MPVYSRETKTKGRVWDVVVADGRKRVWRRGLATKREAQAEERRLKTAQEQGIDINPARLTLVTYLEHWLTDYVAGLGETTRSTYASNLKTHVLPVLGEKLLRDSGQRMSRAATPKSWQKGDLANSRLTSIACSGKP